MKKILVSFLAFAMLFTVANTTMAVANELSDDYIVATDDYIVATNAHQRNQIWWINGNTWLRAFVGQANSNARSLPANSSVAQLRGRSGSYTDVRLGWNSNNNLNNATGWVLTSRISTNCTPQGQCAVR